MRAIALHEDVLVATSAVLHVNCVIVRGTVEGQTGAIAEETQAAGGMGEMQRGAGGEAVAGGQAGETFVIDSPVLPEELQTLPALLEQARFPAPSGLVATHGDWDHLLGRLAFPGVVLGCAQSTVARLSASPGSVQRELRSFDEDLLISRDLPLALGSVQELPVPGRCAVGERELELHPAAGHTGDGMAVLVGWARVLVAGDYLSTVELPTLGEDASLEDYLATLERLRGLVARADHVVPGHGPVLSPEAALKTLTEDLAYLTSLRDLDAGAKLPPGRRGVAQRRLHRENVEAACG
jgi:glyoxylase-like metal-dependent hydrolase (beta-lactamase superfamily II)